MEAGAIYARQIDVWVCQVKEKYKWYIDPVASAHVRTIFEMAMKGNTTIDIAHYMNE